MAGYVIPISISHFQFVSFLFYCFILLPVISAQFVTHHPVEEDEPAIFVYVGVILCTLLECLRIVEAISSQKSLVDVTIRSSKRVHGKSLQ